jgi:hypothetical protein
MGRLKGVKDLVEDAVHHGATAVEKVHRGVASRPFDVLEAVPIVAVPARGVRLVHDTITATVYASIRVMNRLVGAVADEVIEVVEKGGEASEHDGET